MRVNIAIDVDGVLAEQVIPVISIINAKYSIGLSKEDITSWEFPIGNSDIKKEIELAEMEEDFIVSMTPIEGSVITTKKLSEEFNIIIATGRMPITDNWTIRWLNSNHIPYNTFVNTRESGKSIPEADFLVDDYDKNINYFISSGSNSRKAILFKQPWNTNHELIEPLIQKEKVYIADSWNAVLRVIRSLCRDN